MPPQTAVAAGLTKARRLALLYSGAWLIWLFYPLQAAWRLDSPAGRWVGILSTTAFGVVFMPIFGPLRRRRPSGQSFVPLRVAALLLAALTALGTVMVLVVGQSALVTGLLAANCAVVLLPVRLGVPVVIALAAGVAILPRMVDGWVSNPTVPTVICVSAIGMWGVTRLINANIDLVQAREENARLAVEAERNRLARDLHDILGHSLTVITVKAELAGRLMDVDLVRARAEVADLERLSRDALVDVRRAVEGYRELTLPGELARAREALAAAEIEADVPSSAELVPSELRELFGWAVREGVTNVIRHSGASRCSISLTASAVKIEDNGPGPGAGNGKGHGHGQSHGLMGLRERAVAVGAILVIRSLEPQGYSLAVVAGGAP